MKVEWHQNDDCNWVLKAGPFRLAKVFCGDGWSRCEVSFLHADYESWKHPYPSVEAAKQAVEDAFRAIVREFMEAEK